MSATSFPSLAWFEAAKARTNADAAFKKLGTADTRFAIKHDDAVVEVQFDAFAIGTVAERSVEELREFDFYLEMSSVQWHDYLDGLRRPGAKRSISDVDLQTDGGVVKGESALGKNNAFRYLCSVDRFFELGAMQ